MMNTTTAPLAANFGRLTHLDVEKGFRFVEPAQAQFLTVAQIEAWNELGYILNLPLLNEPELRAAREFFFRLNEENRHHSLKFNTHTKHAVAYDLVRHPRTLKYLQDLIGPDIVCFISEYIHKKPGAPMGNQGHQDCVFNAMDVGCPIVWLALEDADEANGCMQFVPGSHRLGVQECDENFALRDVSLFQQWVPARVQAGHCVVMSDLLIHSSPGNPSTTRFRPAFTATYASARTPLLQEHTAEPILCGGENVHPSWKLRPRP